MYRITWLASCPPKVGYWINTWHSATYLQTWLSRDHDHEVILEDATIRLAPLKLEEIPADAAVINGWYEEIPGDV